MEIYKMNVKQPARNSKTISNVLLYLCVRDNLKMCFVKNRQCNEKWQLIRYIQIVCSLCHYNDNNGVKKKEKKKIALKMVKRLPCVIWMSQPIKRDITPSKRKRENKIFKLVFSLPHYKYTLICIDDHVLWIK